MGSIHSTAPIIDIFRVMCGERPIRFSLKLLQFMSSAFVVYCLFRTGPHWMLTLACLIVPLFGIYLILKSPDQKKHKLPHRIYWAVAKGKSWLRVDVTICLTMSVVFFGFAIILFYGFFKLIPQNVYLLFAGLGSLLVSSLYLINAFVSIGQLRIGTVDFASTMTTQRMSLPKVDNSRSNSLSKSPFVLQSKLRPDPEELRVRVDNPNPDDVNKSIDDPTSVNYRSINLLLRTADSYPYGKHKSNTCTGSRAMVEQPEMDQKIIDYIKEQLDESLDREYSSMPSDSAKETSKKYRYAPSRILQTNQAQHMAARQKPDSSSISSLTELTRRTPPTVDASPRALPIKPPPLLNSAEEIRRMAQFNEGFVASEASTPLDNRSTGQERRVLNGFTIGVSNAQAIPNEDESKNLNESSGDVAPAPVGQRIRRFTAKSNDSSSARRRFSKGEESALRNPRADKSSDEDSTSISGSGSLGSAVHEYENSTTLERSNSDIGTLSSIVAMNEDMTTGRWREGQQRNRDKATTSGIQDGGLQRTRRNSTPHSYYMKRVYRHSSNDSQFSNYGFVDSDEDSAPYRKHSNTLPSAHISALTHQLGGSFDPSCIPSIVTAIDSSRVSDIRRHNSPRRTSSRARKMNGRRGFDVVIRAQSENDITERRSNNNISAVNERPVDAFFVTEF